MFKLNEWNENEKISLYKLANDITNESMNTSCCIDTGKITAGPCSDDIKTSCCIDTMKE